MWQVLFLRGGVDINDTIKYIYNSELEKLTDGLYGVIRNGYATLFFENFKANDIEIGTLKTYYTLPDKYKPVRNVYGKLFLNSQYEETDGGSNVITMPHFEINHHGPLRMLYSAKISIVGTICYPVCMQ